MNLSEILTYNRGNPIAVDLQIDGTPLFDPATATVVMKMKPAHVSAPVPPRTTPVTSTFTVSYTPAAGSNKAFWRGMLDAETSRNLAAGAYVVDATITSAGSVVQVADPVRIILNESVTPL